MTDLPSNFERLVGQAAGRMDPQWSAQRTETTLAGLHRRRVRRTVVRGTVGAALLLCGVAWGAQRFGPADSGPSPAVAMSVPEPTANAAGNGETADSDANRPGTEATGGSLALSLSDGTRVVPVDRGARVVEVAGGERVRARLVTGRSRFDRTAVAGSQQLELEAGNIRVHVFSSRFSAARYEAEVELWVEDGFVEVTTDGTDDADSARYTVKAGQHRTFSLGDPADLAETARDGRSAATSGDAPSPARATQSTRDRRQQVTAAAVINTPGADAAAEAATAQPPRTAPKTRVTRQPPPRRADGSVAEKAPADAVGRLLERADRERRTGRPAAAATALRRIVRHHDDDPRAALAGFTLGRVLLDDLGRAAAAARAFDRARRLDPSGPLAEDALARAADAWFRAGEPNKARDRADAYLDRYPNGHRARAVRQYSAR